jgi:hypothetical protein
MQIALSFPGRYLRTTMELTQYIFMIFGPQAIMDQAKSPSLVNLKQTMRGDRPWKEPVSLQLFFNQIQSTDKLSLFRIIFCPKMFGVATDPGVRLT